MGKLEDRIVKELVKGRLRVKEFTLERDCIGGRTASYLLTTQTIANSVEQTEPFIEQSYSFKGNLHLRHLISDCIANKQNSFIAIGTESALIGFTRQLDFNNCTEFSDMVEEVVPGQVLNWMAYPFHVYKISLIHTNRAIKFLKQVPDLLVKQIENDKRTVRNERRKFRKENIKRKKADKNAKWESAEKVKVLVY